MKLNSLEDVLAHEIKDLHSAEKMLLRALPKMAKAATDENLRDIDVLRRYAEVRHVEFTMPVYMHVVDRREFLMSHPIPDDDAFYRGDDIAIEGPGISDAPVFQFRHAER